MAQDAVSRCTGGIPSETSVLAPLKILPDADFEPNPDRAVRVEGRLDEPLLERLRPQILELTSSSKAPVTVFINSRGGSSEVAEAILSLLRDVRVITVAAPTAHSAAAALLSAGDFALASPESSLLYHGGRWPLSDLVSAGEAGRLYGHTLPVFHEKNAAKLAQNSVRRFLFITAALRPTFAEHRADKGDPSLSDLQAFQEILRVKLSPAGQKVLERAIPLCKSYNALLLHFQKKLRRGRDVTKEHLKKLMLYSAVDLECDPAAWDAGLTKICDQFHFLNSYFDFGALRDWVAGRPEPQTADQDIDALQFRLFFLAICRSLQEGENYITPLDAVWLGLVDTLRADIASPRVF